MSLAALSTDVLGRITYFLNGPNTLLQLYATGNLMLFSKFRNGGLVNIVCSRQPILRLISFAEGLKTLKIEISRFSWSSLPPNLVNLSIHSESIISLSCCPMPSIESFELGLLQNLDEFPKLNYCFPNLEKLTILLNTDTQKLRQQFKYLPNSIHTLLIPGTELRTEDIKMLPSSITSLTCKLLAFDSTTTNALPPYLIYLNASSRSDITQIEVFEEMPISLETLLVNAVVTFTAPNFSFLPPRITDLKLSAVNVSHEGFPLKLTKLSFSWHVMSDQEMLELPGTLTHIDICADEITDNGLRKLPSGLVFLRLVTDTKLTDLAIPMLPSGLTYLSMCSKNFTDASIPLLPRQLTSLALYSMRNLTDAIVASFPRRLTDLNIDSAKLLTKLSLPAFPPFLTKLGLFGNSLINWRDLSLLPCLHYKCHVSLNSSAFLVVDHVTSYV